MFYIVRSDAQYSQANATTYNESDMCDSPAKDYGFISPGTINTVVMDG